MTSDPAPPEPPEPPRPPHVASADAADAARHAGQARKPGVPAHADGDPGAGGEPAASGTETTRPTTRHAPRWIARLLRPTAQEAGPEAEAEATVEGLALRPVRIGFGLAIGAAIAVLLWIVLADLTQLMLWISVALFIALGLDPIVRFFEARGWPRAGGVAVVIVLLLAAVGAFLGTLIPALVTQISQLVTRLPVIVQAVQDNGTVKELDAQFHFIQAAEDQLDKFTKDASAVGGLFSGVLGAGTVLGQFAFGVLIVLVLAIYFLVSLPALKRFVYSLTPRSSRPRTRRLGETITRSVGNYVMGQATVAVLNALVAFVVMTILQVPYSALLALCVVVLAFIPLVGGVIAGVLVTVVTLFSGGWQHALIYAILYFAYLQLEAYLISPKVMSKAVKVPGAVAVIAVIAGGTLLGVAGALMAIPVAAAVMLLVNEIWVKRQDAR